VLCLFEMGILRCKMGREDCTGCLALEVRLSDSVVERLKSANSNPDHMNLRSSAGGMYFGCLIVPENHEGPAGSVRLMQVVEMSSPGRTYCAETQCYM